MGKDLSGNLLLMREILKMKEGEWEASHKTGDETENEFLGKVDQIR